MLDFLRRLRTSSAFMRNNAIFFVGSLLVGGLNYLYYPVVGRMLPPDAFGEVQALVSLFLQLAAFLSALSLIVVSLVANATNQDDAKQTIVDFEKATVAASIVLLLVTIVVSPLLGQFFQFKDSSPFVALALALVVSVPFTFRTAFLRGQKQFGQVSLANILLAASKLVLSVGLVALGLGTIGAVSGLVGAQLCALVFALVAAGRVGLTFDGLRKYVRGLPSLRRLLPELRYAGLVLVVSLVITLQYSIDILVVKHFFSPNDAGLYAGIAAVARILFFLTASIAQVMLPSLTVRDEGGKNWPLLYKSTLLLIGISSPVLIACVFLPGLVVQLLMGEAYVNYSHLLPPLAVAVFVIALLNLFMSYFVALRRYSVMAVALGGSALTVGLLVSGQHSLHAIVNNLLIGSMGMFGMLALWFGGMKMKRRYIS